MGVFTLSLALLWGYGGILCFGQSAFFGLGAYAYAIAAINFGGQTIHSFFGFPPRLIQPGDIRRSRNGRAMRKLEFLIIDEVSMVRSDLMWGIDQALRVNRGRPRERASWVASEVEPAASVACRLRSRRGQRHRGRAL